MKKCGRISLIEILVVIAVISVVVGILFPLFFKSRGGNVDHHGICKTCQGRIYEKIASYTDDHNGIFPLSSEVWTKIKYDPESLICYMDNNNKNGYLYNNNISGIDFKKTKFDFSKKMMLIDGETTIVKRREIKNIYYTSDDIRYRHGNFAIIRYLDGHSSPVKFVTEPESWDKPKVQKKTGKKK